MTDGDYNTIYSGDESETQAGQFCTNMKAKNIVIYTIGFMVSNSAKSFLQGCATGTTYYYDATDGDVLKAAFRDIALKVSSLRLTQ